MKLKYFGPVELKVKVLPGTSKPDFIEQSALFQPVAQRHWPLAWHTPFPEHWFIASHLWLTIEQPFKPWHMKLFLYVILHHLRCCEVIVSRNKMTSFWDSHESKVLALVPISSNKLTTYRIRVCNIVDFPRLAPEIRASWDWKAFHPDCLTNWSIFGIKFTSVNENGKTVVYQVLV